MASATSLHQRRLREFLMEQQEPFILSNYLSERGCSRTWSLQRSANSCLNMNAKLPFSRVLTSLCKKLASQHNEGSNVVAERPQVRDENLVVRESPTIGEIVLETERFSSSSSSSTRFYSCSEIDEDEISFSSDTFQASNAFPTGMQSQQDTNNGKHRWRFIVPSRRAAVSQHEVAVNKDVRKIEKKIQRCSVSLHKKTREESISSAAIWGLLMQPSVKKERGPRKLRDSIFQGLKSRRAIFYCAREKLPRKDKGEQCHSKEMGKSICKRTDKYGGRGVGCLFSLNDLNSLYEWSDLEPHVKNVIIQIGDAILECIINEIVSEFFEY
ncbi:hypothetical protein K1719_010692 [Acacia pycnantha]|nr:hypothetical protein K1719_010692 [Acacia pycnantha]